LALFIYSLSHTNQKAFRGRRVHVLNPSVSLKCNTTYGDLIGDLLRDKESSIALEYKDEQSWHFFGRVLSSSPQKYFVSQRASQYTQMTF
jgi:hypothetical protein